ncbi:hypothetical protein F2Q69_00002931 [Brassica cretica]|uniref:Cyclin C-terminal domain-containing protein n=1 Tax=Brassica cretica TaxID=69181 RepID=A0A8S9P1E4_BRACR|nr:hypothetical protein F2Q69_00002931 [Brassica cretica]
MLAASAVYTARCSLNKSPAWTETLKFHTEAYIVDKRREEEEEEEEEVTLIGEIPEDRHVGDVI